MEFKKNRSIKSIFTSSTSFRRLVSPARTVHRLWTNSKSRQFHQIYADIISHAVASILALEVQGKEEYSSLGKLSHPAISKEHTESIRVTGKKIDTLVEEYRLHPEFIKNDAEGGEMQVQMGARKTLINHHPKLMMELSDESLNQCGATSQQVFEMLSELGYHYPYQVDHGLYSDVFAVISE